jgi:hypothetical protein
VGKTLSWLATSTTWSLQAFKAKPNHMINDMSCPLPIFITCTSYCIHGVGDLFSNASN